MASRAERRAGELLREMAEKGERARGGGDIADKSSAKETLYDLGVTKQQSHNWQKLAALAVALVAALACPGRHHARDKISLHWKVGGVRLQNSRLPIRAILALAVWGFLSLGGANAGTCVNRQNGTDTVQSCDNGSYTVTDRHGRRRVYGTSNAGFERYPGQGERPVYRRRDD
jgi:hypothetical protein